MKVRADDCGFDHLHMSRLWQGHNQAAFSITVDSRQRNDPTRLDESQPKFEADWACKLNLPLFVSELRLEHLQDIYEQLCHDRPKD